MALLRKTTGNAKQPLEANAHALARAGAAVAKARPLTRLVDGGSARVGAAEVSIAAAVEAANAGGASARRRAEGCCLETHGLRRQHPEL
jgi:hypothetical protein